MCHGKCMFSFDQKGLPGPVGPPGSGGPNGEKVSSKSYILTLFKLKDFIVLKINYKIPKVNRKYCS